MANLEADLEVHLEAHLEIHLEAHIVEPNWLEGPGAWAPRTVLP